MGPAVPVAVQFERAHCGWSWRESREAYLAGQQQLATISFARQLAGASDPVTWDEEVIAQKQTVSCTVHNAVRMVDAPSTASTATL